jgi:nucleoside-diphosphate-sugar epimerase
MKVLVTGDQGYVGSVLVPTLLESGYEVVGTDVGFFKECFLGDMKVPNYLCLEKDVRSLEAADLKGFDAIIHLAALCNDPLAKFTPDLTIEINKDASFRLAGLAKQVGIQRFIYASSCSLYGAAEEEWLDERAEFQPVSAYGESKIEAEKAIGTLANDAFSPCFLRFATAYGASPRPRFDIVLNNLVGWAVTTGEIKLMSDGMAWRPMIHVKDMCKVYMVVLEAPLSVIHNHSYNVGQDSENYLVKNIATAVKATIANTEMIVDAEASKDARSYKVSFKKLDQAFPNLKMDWNIEKGTEELYKSYKDANLSLEKFKGRTFNRLLQLQYLMETNQINRALVWKNS